MLKLLAHADLDHAVGGKCEGVPRWHRLRVERTTDYVVAGPVAAAMHDLRARKGRLPNAKEVQEVLSDFWFCIDSPLPGDGLMASLLQFEDDPELYEGEIWGWVLDRALMVYGLIAKHQFEFEFIREQLREGQGLSTAKISDECTGVIDLNVGQCAFDKTRMQFWRVFASAMLSRPEVA